MKPCWVYIVASRSRVLYTGVTSDLKKRVLEHRAGTHGGFTSRYNCYRLVYLEELDGPVAAIDREKPIKGWARDKKVALIETWNPTWKDLSRGETKQSGIPRR